MSYLQTKFQKHRHSFHIDLNTNELICLCGKIAGKKSGKETGVEKKYRNKTSVYNGYPYDSIKEAEEAKNLDLLLKAGEIISWERQYPIEVYVNGEKMFRMKVDFLVNWKDGTKELREVKGWITAREPVYRLKRKLIDAIWLKENPEFTYKVVD